MINTIEFKSHFDFLSEIKDLLLHMKANELKDNPYLQLTLLQACRTCTKFVYSLVVEHVAPPAIIWALSMEIMNNRDIANQVYFLATIFNKEMFHLHYSLVKFLL